MLVVYNIIAIDNFDFCSFYEAYLNERTGRDREFVQEYDQTTCQQLAYTVRFQVCDNDNPKMNNCWIVFSFFIKM